MKRNWLYFLIAAISVAMPLVIYGARYGVLAPVYLFNGDSFYYLDVVKHSLHAPGFSFDGQFQTNGFHPLWEWLLVLATKFHLLHLDSLSGTLMRVYWLNVLLLAMGCGAFCAAVSRWLDRPRFVLLAVAPGLFWVLTASVEPSYYCTWAYVNGMESALALFCFSLALLLYNRNDMGVGRIASLSVWLGLATLARLDDIFITAAAATFLLLMTVQARRLRTMLALLPFPLMIAAYLAYNRTHLGVFLPISGAAKAHFALANNLKATLRLLMPGLAGMPPTAMRSVDIGFSQLSEEGGRILQIVLPAVLCGIELLHVWRRRAQRDTLQLFHALAVGVIAKAAYDFAFVVPLDQGQWYFTASIAVANFILVLWISRSAAVLTRSDSRRALPWLFYTGYAIWVLLASSIFLAHRNDEDRVSSVHLLADSRPLNAKLQSLQASRFVEFEDGFLGYVADVPSIGGLGLVLDPQAMLAIKQGRFLELVYRRGYRVAVAGGNYATTLQRLLDDRERTGADIGALTMRAAEFHRFRLEPIGGDGTTDGLLYYRIVPMNTPVSSISNQN